MARLRWTKPALRDLDDIAEYIALDNPGAAARLVRKTFDRVERLKKFPKSGRRPPELHRTPYREIIVPPCRVFYRIKRETIYILHVMRGERLLRPYLLDQRKRQE